jgi:diguanylate cyclase (GGDEF)-like protein
MSKRLAVKTHGLTSVSTSPITPVEMQTIGFYGVLSVVCFFVLKGFMDPMFAGTVATVGSTGLFTYLKKKTKTAFRADEGNWDQLERLSRDMDSLTDPDQLALLLTTVLSEAMDISALYIWLPMRDKRDFYLAAGQGMDPERTTLSEAWIQDYFQLLNPEEPLSTPLEQLRQTELGRWLHSRRLVWSLPLMAHGKLIGLLTLGPKRSKRQYNDNDRRLMQQAIRISSIALAYLMLQKEEKRKRSRLDNLTHLYKDAQMRAITDGLTGLTTHVFFQEQLGQRFYEARRHASELSVMLVDIDHFKRFNDTFGHPVGDEVLRRVSACVKTEARTCDTVARYGGEELVLVLPQTDLQGATVLAERVRQAIMAIEISDNKGRRLPQITASLGVAQLTDNDQAPIDLIERADKALYAAKNRGRNQVCQFV